MRRRLGVLIFIPLMFVSCGEELTDITNGGESTEYTNLSISFSTQPQGGTNVTSVLCEFEGKLVGGDKQLCAYVLWKHIPVGGDTQIVKNEVRWFSSHEPSLTSTTYNAYPGEVLIGYFYVNIYWYDTNEARHEVNSSKASCIVDSEE